MKSTPLSAPSGQPINSSSLSGSAAGSSRTDATSTASSGKRLADNPDGFPPCQHRTTDEGTLRVGAATLGSPPSRTATPQQEPLQHADHPASDDAATTPLQAERGLPGIYTPMANPVARKRHGHHQEALAQALVELKALRRPDGLDFRDIVARELPGLLQKAGFDAGIYAARNSGVGGYGRYLLHSDPDPKERFCLQIFAFDPRQKTPIHNHPNECASYIAQGTLMERLYELPEAAAASGHDGQVAKTRKDERPQTSWAGFDSTQLLVPHSLKNHSSSMAVSVHLYRDMDGVSAGQQVAAAEKFERFKP